MPGTSRSPPGRVACTGSRYTRKAEPNSPLSRARSRLSTANAASDSCSCCRRAAAAGVAGVDACGVGLLRPPARPAPAPTPARRARPRSGRAAAADQRQRRSRTVTGGGLAEQQQHQQPAHAAAHEALEAEAGIALLLGVEPLDDEVARLLRHAVCAANFRYTTARGRGRKLPREAFRERSDLRLPRKTRGAPSRSTPRKIDGGAGAFTESTARTPLKSPARPQTRASTGRCRRSRPTTTWPSSGRRRARAAGLLRFWRQRRAGAGQRGRVDSRRHARCVKPPAGAAWFDLALRRGAARRRRRRLARRRSPPASRRPRWPARSGWRGGTNSF